MGGEVAFGFIRFTAQSNSGLLSYKGLVFRLALLTVLPLHVEPQPCKQDDVGHEDDGVGPPGAVKAVVGEGVEHRRGEELQRVRGDVEQDVGVPRQPEQEGHHQGFGAVLLRELVLEAGARESGEQPPRDEHTDGHDHGTVGVLVHVPGDGGEVRGHGGVVHGGALEAVHRGVDEGRDKGEEIGQDAHRSGDLPVDVLAGDEHAPEPVGEDVHASATNKRLFNSPLFPTDPGVWLSK